MAEEKKVTLCINCHNKIINGVRIECRLRPASYTDYTTGKVVPYFTSGFIINDKGKCEDYLEIKK